MSLACTNTKIMQNPNSSPYSNLAILHKCHRINLGKAKLCHFQNNFFTPLFVNTDHFFLEIVAAVIAKAFDLISLLSTMKHPSLKIDYCQGQIERGSGSVITYCLCHCCNCPWLIQAWWGGLKTASAPLHLWVAVCGVPGPEGDHGSSTQVSPSSIILFPSQCPLLARSRPWKKETAWCHYCSQFSPAPFKTTPSSTGEEQLWG